MKDGAKEGPTGTVTADGQRLIERWTHAIAAWDDLKRQENQVWCEVQNAKNALAKWLKPEDAKPGETYAVWSGDSMIQVVVEHTVEEDGVKTFVADHVSIRKRGRSI